MPLLQTFLPSTSLPSDLTLMMLNCRYEKSKIRVKLQSVPVRNRAFICLLFQQLLKTNKQEQTRLPSKYLDAETLLL